MARTEEPGHNSMERIAEMLKQAAGMLMPLRLRSGFIVHLLKQLRYMLMHFVALLKHWPDFRKQERYLLKQRAGMLMQSCDMGITGAGL